MLDARHQMLYAISVAESPKEKRFLIDLSTGSLLRALAILLALWLLFVMRDLLAILFIAVVLAATLSPIVDHFQRHRLPRTLIIILLYFVIIILLGAFVYFVLPPVIIQFRQLISQLPAYFTAVTDFLEQLRKATGSSLPNQPALGSFLSGIFGNLFATTLSFFGGAAAFATILILTLYLLLEENGIKKFFLSVVPIKQKARIARIANRIGLKLGGWLRGQLILALAVGLITYVGLRLMGIPYALTLALIAGVFEIIPVLGPILAAIPAIIVAFTVSPMMALLVTLFYIAVQELENKLLVPKVMQYSVGLNPVTIIIILLIGAKLMGIIGMLLAIPVALVIYVILEEWLVFGEPERD